jgi:two-component system chemotaxis response regulator CheY
MPQSIAVQGFAALSASFTASCLHCRKKCLIIIEQYANLIGGILMKTLMIVDDSNYIRTVIKALLRNVDVKVIAEATNGTEGVELYKKHKPDIVTMDVVMDEQSGIEALKQIKEFDPNAVVLIISTVVGQDLILDDALASGAKKVFKKPIDKEPFLECIQELLNA